MRITIVQGPYFPIPPLLASGVEKMWFGLAGAFAERGHQVVHVSRRYSGLPWRERLNDVEQIRIPSFDAPRSRIVYRALDLVYSWRARRVLPRGFDILVTNCMWLPILVRSRKFGALYVHVARRPKGQMWLYRHADRLQTVSTAIRDAICAERRVRPGRVRVIPPYVTNLPEPAGARAPAGRENLILYVGRVHPEKGLDLLIKAFAEIADRDWRLAIVGPHQHERGGGGEDYRAELMGMASAQADRIFFEGTVEQERLNGYFERAALLVYPSVAERGESFGAVPLEAMACGCPVLVSALDCFRDYLKPGANGLVFDHRSSDPVRALVGELRRLMAEPGLRERLAAQGIETAARYTLPSIAAKFLEDFSSLCGDAGA